MSLFNKIKNSAFVADCTNVLENGAHYDKCYAVASALPFLCFKAPLDTAAKSQGPLRKSVSMPPTSTISEGFELVLLYSYNTRFHS